MVFLSWVLNDRFINEEEGDRNIKYDSTDTRQYRVQENGTSHVLTRHQYGINLDVQSLLGGIMAAEEFLRKITSLPWTPTATNSKWDIYTNSYVLPQPQILWSSWNKLLSASKIYCIPFVGDFFQSFINWLRIVECFFSTLSCQ